VPLTTAAPIAQQSMIWGEGGVHRTDHKLIVNKPNDANVLLDVNFNSPSSTVKPIVTVYRSKQLKIIERFTGLQRLNHYCAEFLPLWLLSQLLPCLYTCPRQMFYFPLSLNCKIIQSELVREKKIKF
jgi:hypothetical protein